MAIRALNRRMRAGQREPRTAVIEGRTAPLGCAVADLAILRERSRGMVRRRGGVVFRKMA
jgi:hypothetical protein